MQSAEKTTTGPPSRIKELPMTHWDWVATPWRCCLQCRHTIILFHFEGFEVRISLERLSELLQPASSVSSEVLSVVLRGWNSSRFSRSSQPSASLIQSLSFERCDGRRIKQPYSPSQIEGTLTVFSHFNFNSRGLRKKIQVEYMIDKYWDTM